MKYCPVMSFQRETNGSPQIVCLGEKCGFADKEGECLIKQALEFYVISIKDKIRQFEAESK